MKEPKKPFLIISFLWRYAALVIVFIALAALSRFDQVTYFIGPVFYVVQLVVTCALASLFARHLFMRSTLDEYAIDPPSGPSDFVKDWRALDPRTKIILSVIVIVAFYLGAALIAANLAK